MRAMHGGREVEAAGPLTPWSPFPPWRTTFELEHERNKLDSLIWGCSGIPPYRILTKSLYLGGPS